MGSATSRACAHLGQAFGATLLAVAAAAAAQGATAPATRSRGHDAPHAAPVAAGFSIDRATPAWTVPVVYDPATPIANAPYQILVSDRQFRVQSGVTTDFMHYMRRINSTSGLEQGGQIEVEFDPSYQKLVLHHIDILRGDERINKLDAKNVKLLHREQQLERQMVDGRMTASVVLDDLRVGDRVEWEASIVGANPVFDGKFVNGDWTQYLNGPTGQWQVRVLAPEARDIRLKVGDPKVQVATTLHDGLRDTRLTATNLAQFSANEQLPAAEYLKVQVEFSEFADWGQVADWAAQLFARSMRPTPALDREVEALETKAGRGASSEALLRVALDFVQKDIRYFGTEMGPSSHQPADVDTVLRQRFGDCKDKVSLLAALLTRMGFDARPAIVSATFQEASALHLPSPLAFDHAIVRVMLDGKPVWLDATRSEQTGRIATRESRGLGYALLAQEGNTTLSELPSARTTVHAEIVDTFAFPKLSQEGTLTSVLTLHGDLAEGLRQALGSQPRDEIAKRVTADTLRAYPNMTLVGPVEFQTATEDDSLVATAHYRTGDYWSLQEQRSLLGHYSLYGLIAPLRLPDQNARTQPFRIASPGRYLHTIRFDFGEEIPGASKSTRFDETNPNFDLHVQYDFGLKHERIEGELDQLTDSVAAADWKTYRDKLNKAAPRLVGDFTLPPYSLEQMQALRTEGDALMTQMHDGRVKTVTSVQSSARFKVLGYDKELASDRLPPKLRAQILLARGVQLDFIGRLADARADFVASIQLDDSNADAHDALASNAAFRRQNDEALKEAAEALRLAPTSMHPYFVRGYTHFFDGEMQAAGGDFRDALQSHAEVERGYGALWLYLATRRAGGDGVAAVKDYEPTSTGEWPGTLLQLMEGRIDFATALAASHENGQRSPGRECELYFYAGEKAAAEGDLGKARGYLDSALATGVTEFNEYVFAQRELDRLASR